MSRFGAYCLLALLSLRDVERSKRPVCTRSGHEPFKFCIYPREIYHLTPSLHHHRQIHIRVNGAIEVVSACCVEWPDSLAVVAIELHIVHHWRAALLHGLSSSIHPTAIGEDMRCRRIVDHCNATALANGNGLLCKILIGHMDGAATAPSRTTAAGYHQYRQ